MSLSKDAGRSVPVHASGGGGVTDCLFCDLPYSLHDRAKNNWLACPTGLFECLEARTWPVQGQPTAPSNLRDWLLACNRYPQFRGREAALELIVELWWKASGIEAATAGETTKSGSTVGESPVGSEADETPNLPTPSGEHNHG